MEERAGGSGRGTALMGIAKDCSLLLVKFFHQLGEQCWHPGFCKVLSSTVAVFTQNDLLVWFILFVSGNIFKTQTTKSVFDKDSKLSIMN